MTKAELLSELMRCMQRLDVHAAGLVTAKELLQSALQANADCAESLAAEMKAVLLTLNVVRRLPVPETFDLDELPDGIDLDGGD